VLNEYPYKQQQTIQNEISIKGIGLHTGVETVATFKPAKENFGIRFKRLDLEDCPEIIADIDHVVRHEAAVALGSIGNESARDALIRATSDEDQLVSHSAYSSLLNLDLLKINLNKNSSK